MSNWNARLHIPCRRINNNSTKQQQQHQAVSSVNGENFSHFAWAHKFTSHTQTHFFSFFISFFVAVVVQFFLSKFIASSCHNLITIADMLVNICVNVVFFSPLHDFHEWIFSRYCYLFRLHNIMLEKCGSTTYHTHIHICTTSVLRVVFFFSLNDSLKLVWARAFFCSKFSISNSFFSSYQ